MDAEKILSIVFGAGLALFSIGVVAYSFLKSRPTLQSTVQDLAPGSQNSEIEAIYDAIRTLDLEHRLGNIPEALYREQMLAYRLNAANILRQQAARQLTTQELQLEEEVLKAREERAQPSESGRVCPSCQTATSLAAISCSRCGAALETSGTSQL